MTSYKYFQHTNKSLCQDSYNINVMFYSLLRTYGSNARTITLFGSSFSVPVFSAFLFCLFLHFAWGIAKAKCILARAVCVCVCVCLSLAAFSHYCTHPDAVYVVVHYSAYLQSMQGFRCYDNIAPNAKCQRVLVLYASTSNSLLWRICLCEIRV